MIWDRELGLAVIFFAPVAFAIAVFTEARAGESVAERIRHVIVPSLGIAMFWLMFTIKPTREPNVLMVMLSAVVASSGSFIHYSRRSSSVLVACGGLILVFLWMLNRAIPSSQ